MRGDDEFSIFNCRINKKWGKWFATSNQKIVVEETRRGWKGRVDDEPVAA